ncbi:DUF6445 family protein [Paraglaciecola aquimarina]|uniref:DUF6445 family protein n=1 Tax=Paraglaciecola algarum TaxID=3050085 RepID=A0ABS9D3Y1_9ALTE|nr:DUF6445 family protein [Paraglaciecola sp. G1-23]MCF2946732.1 DUF6445 family protein [Paraglaciecola sp. G1-23]
MKITKQYFGNENIPILIVDNFVEQIEQLTEFSKNLKFERNSPFYPGIRAATPTDYQELIVNSLRKTLVEFFELPNSQLTFPVSHYSIVNTPAEKLNLLQKIPHFDSLDKNGLAAVHYLFKDDLGGTSFYRHRKTGYEMINQSRKIDYLRSLESENDGPNMPKKSDGYINGNTPLFERIGEQQAKYNRIIFYRRNSLHSGSIPKNLIKNSHTSNTRLTISNFMDFS